MGGWVGGGGGGGVVQERDWVQHICKHIIGLFTAAQRHFLPCAQACSTCKHRSVDKMGGPLSVCWRQPRSLMWSGAAEHGPHCLVEPLDLFLVRAARCFISHFPLENSCCHVYVSVSHLHANDGKNRHVDFCCTSFRLEPIGPFQCFQHDCRAALHICPIPPPPAAAEGLMLAIPLLDLVLHGHMVSLAWIMDY